MITIKSLVSAGKLEPVFTPLLPLFPQAFRYITFPLLERAWPAIRAAFVASGHDVPPVPDKHFIETVMKEDTVQLASEIDSDPFKTLIRTILSARSKDEQTIKVSNELFEHYDTAGKLARAPEEHVKEIIRPIGFYNAKTKNIINTAKQLLERHDGEVPRDYTALCALPGVGAKVANCVLVYAFGIPAIPVDTHVHRIVNRWGIVQTTDPEKTNKLLENLLPRDYWLVLNDLLVRFGKRICKPVIPSCEVCPLGAICPRLVTRPLARARVQPARGSRSTTQASQPASRPRS